MHSGHQNAPLPLFTPGMKVHLLCAHRDLLCYPITLLPTQLCNITSSSTSSAVVAQIVRFGLNTDTLLSAHTAVLKTYYFERVGAQSVFTLTKYAKNTVQKCLHAVWNAGHFTPSVLQTSKTWRRIIMICCHLVQMLYMFLHQVTLCLCITVR